MKRSLLLTLIATVAATAYAAEPPAKRSGGLFGFGAPKNEQISAGLFPSENTTPAASPSSPEGEAIFKAGQPQPVEPVSYVIENGRKVVKPVENIIVQPSEGESSGTILAASNEKKKKGGIFGFGKREDTEVEENEIVTPVPKPIVAAPAKPGPLAAPAKPVAAPVSVTAPSVAPADTPTFEGIKNEKEEKSGWGPFRSKKKSEAPVVTETALAATPVPVVASPVASTAAGPANEKSKKPANATSTGTGTATVTATAPAAAGSNTFEVPRNEAKKGDAKKEEKSSRDGSGILSPIANIANIRAPRKEIDLSSAETIIQNGEIVAGSDVSFDAAPMPPMTSGSATKQAPQVINGVKTYSSWDDVNARSSSAADRIINKIR